MQTSPFYGIRKTLPCTAASSQVTMQKRGYDFVQSPAGVVQLNWLIEQVDQMPEGVVSVFARWVRGGWLVAL